MNTEVVGIPVNDYVSSCAQGAAAGAVGSLFGPAVLTAGIGTGALAIGGCAIGGSITYVGGAYGQFTANLFGDADTGIMFCSLIGGCHSFTPRN